MNENPLVSVLMTSYNREKYIAEAIESVLLSTYTHFELIIVDDGSKDDTVKIAKSYAERDARIQVYENEVNLGDYPNRNKAASYAKGKYLKYIDADDYIYPWGLAILVQCMEQFPESGWGFCSLDQNMKKPYPFQMSPTEAYEAEYFGRGLLNKAPLSAIIKREFFEAAGGFSGKQYLGDFELWHILAIRYPLVLMPQGIVWYRMHDEQQSNDNRTNPIVPFKYILLSLQLFRCNNEIPLSDDKKNAAESKIVSRIRRIILRSVVECKFSVAFKMYSMYRDTLRQIEIEKSKKSS